MAVTVEEIQIVVDAKVDKALRGLKTAEKGSNSFSKNMIATAKTIAGPLVLGLIVKSFANIGRELIKSASDAEETRNKFSVVFASVADDAEEASDRIKDEFKLSDETVEKFLSGVGDITSGLGATSEEALDAAEAITTLGLDIDSFANLSGGAEQAVSALTSLFTGEREAAKALGIVINDTNLKAYAEDMGKVFKELTPLEKGFLSLELATKQSELALGDFARSADSYANTSKAAAEATKDLKAALGESLLPVATELTSVFTELANKVTEAVGEHNEFQDVIDRIDSGMGSAADKAFIVRKEVASTLADYRAQLVVIEDSADALNLVKDTLQAEADVLLEQFYLQQGQLDYWERIASEEKKVLDIEKERLAEIQRITGLELEAGDLLDKRRKDRLTDEEKLLESLNTQIDTWVQFREIAGVQELLNDLIKERNELLEENTEVVEENQATHEQMLLEAMFDLREYGRVSKEVSEEAALDWQNLAAVGLGAMTSGFEDIGEALVKGKLGIADFGKLFLNSISSVLQALGAELAALATVQLLLGNVPGAAAGYAQSALAFTASGVVKGLSGSFAEGGSFQTQGEQLIKVGDNAGGVERVTVEPLSSTGANTDKAAPSGAVILQVGEESLVAWWNNAAENGNFRVPRRILV